MEHRSAVATPGFEHLFKPKMPGATSSRNWINKHLQTIKFSNDSAFTDGHTLFRTDLLRSLSGRS